MSPNKRGSSPLRIAEPIGRCANRGCERAYRRLVHQAVDPRRETLR
jgi:hypothetical protein